MSFQCQSLCDLHFAIFKIVFTHFYVSAAEITIKKCNAWFTFFFIQRCECHIQDLTDNFLNN